MAIELECKIDYLSLARELVKPVRDAGQAILDIYHQGVSVQIKGDGSPVTKADLASEAILLPAISVAAPSIQIVSEENVTSHGFAVTDRFFLVDPLDGTKEFLKADNKGAFTVNIGLVEGEVEHRDFVLSTTQREHEIVTCQSRAKDKGGTITLDI